MRLLRVANLEAKAPVERLEAPEVRENPREARKGDRCSLAKRLLRDERRRLELAAEREQVVERTDEPG